MRDSALKRTPAERSEHAQERVGEELMRDSALKPSRAAWRLSPPCSVGEELMRDSVSASPDNVLKSPTKKVR